MIIYESHEGPLSHALLSVRSIAANVFDMQRAQPPHTDVVKRLGLRPPVRWVHSFGLRR